MVYCPNHPNEKKPVPYILVHRLLMEKKLGRYLTRQEVVHHIDGNRLNNQLSNLQLFSCNKEHLASTLKGKCPRWTEDGKRRIAEGVKKVSILHRIRADARRNSRMSTPLTTELDSTPRSPSQTEPRLEQLPVGHSPMTKPEKADESH